MEDELERLMKRLREIAAMNVEFRRSWRLRFIEALANSGLPNYKRRKMESESPSTPEIFETSDHVTASQCSSNESSEVAKHCSSSVDLEPKSLETENSTFSNGRFSRETTPASELSLSSSEEMESTASKTASTSLRRKTPEAKTPSTAEIEDFFSAAEKYEQKRFADKYNFDIAKGVPLQGRYQWVPLKP